jgi:hydrogenase maturation protease
MTVEKKIIILGVGNILYSDDGIGIKVIERIMDEYEFPENVTPVDGGILGINLLGIMSLATHLIIVDSVYNKGNPGDLHRLIGDQIPQRIMAKTSLHQVDVLEALTLCFALPNGIPETVIVGVEPEDIATLNPELTKTVEAQIDPLIEMTLKEVINFGGSYEKIGVN